MPLMMVNFVRAQSHAPDYPLLKYTWVRSEYNVLGNVPVGLSFLGRQNS